MASRLSFLLGTYFFAHINHVYSQVAPNAVNITAVDGGLQIDWSVVSDATIRSFTIDATPLEAIGPVDYLTAPGTTVFNFDETSLDTVNWEFNTDRCIYNSITTAGCFSLVTPPTVSNTFVAGGGVYTVTLSASWGFSTSTAGIVGTTTGYLRNGMPYMGRRNGRSDIDGLYTGRVSFQQFTPCTPFPGNMHSGMVVYDYDTNNVLRPLIQFYYHAFCNGNTAHYLYLRVLNFLGSGYTTYLVVSNVGSQPIELGIYRDHANSKWQFFYYIPTNPSNRWIYIASRDVLDNSLPSDVNLTRTTYGFFASNENSFQSRSMTFDRFTQSFGAGIDAFLGNVTNMAARTVSSGLCQDARIVEHSGLFYTTTRTRYSYRMFGLVNGVQYQIRVMSVSATGTRGIFTVPVATPNVAFPTLLNSPGIRPAAFYDATSLLPGNVLRLRDSSGNNRHLVQYIPSLQPLSYGTTFTYPSGAVWFPLGFQELIQQNRSDLGLDLSTSTNGLSILASYKLGYSLQYVYSLGLVSRVKYMYATSGSGNTARPMDDNAGWDVWAHMAGYAGPDFSGPGMRVVASKNPTSTTLQPDVNTIGIQYRTMVGGTAATTHPDFTDPVLYTYNYYPVPAGGYAVNLGGTLTYYTQGKYLLDGCRGINLGKTYDNCFTPLLTASTATSIGQTATVPPFWGPGYRQPSNTVYPPAGYPGAGRTGGITNAGPLTNYDVFSTDTNTGLNQNRHFASPGYLKIGDSGQYATSTFARRNFWGFLYGILIYKDAIIDRGDREIVQRWVSERYGLACPIPAFSNAIISGVNPECKATGIVPSSTVCSASCGSGTSRIGGYNPADLSGYICQPSRGLMLSKGIWCGITCPVLSIPANALTCTQTYHTDSFDYPSSTLLRNLVRYDVAPLYTLQRSENTWTFGNGVLTGTLPYPLDSCATASILDSIFMVNRPVWGDLTVVPGTVFYRADVTLIDNSASAGIAFRISVTTPTNAFAYYRVVLTAGVAGGSFLEHVTFSAGTTTATRISSTLQPTLVPQPGTVYSINVFTNGITIKVTINGISFFDTTHPAIPHGSYGVYLGAGQATFDNLNMEGSCQGNGNCQVREGGSCNYQCAPGYVAVGNTTRTCSSSGYTGAVLRCVPPPPTTTNANPVFSVFEDAPVGFVVGTINTTVASNNTLERVVLYSIDSGNNETKRDLLGNTLTGNPVVDPVFDIGFCSGELSVEAAGAMNFAKGKQTFNLMIRARLAIDATVFTLIPVTVNVLNARSPPAFLESDGITVMQYTTRKVDENPANSTNVGAPVAAVAVEGPSQIITYSILVGDANNIFSIVNSTGQLKVANPAGFDYEGPYKPSSIPNRYDLVIQARDRDFPSKQTTIQVQVDVVDNDDAPVVPAQVFEIIEDLVGTTVILDEKGNTLENVFGTISGVTDDDTLASSDSVTFSASSHPNFAVNSTTGEMLVANAMNLGPVIDRPYSVIDGRAVRAKITLTGMVRDTKSILRADGVTMSGPLSTNFPITIYIMVNNSYGGEGIVSGVKLVNTLNNRQTLDTAGGDQFQILGEGFSAVQLLTGSNVVRVNLTSSPADPFPRTHAVNNCLVVDDNTINCASTTAGFGADLAVVVSWGTVSNTKIMPTKTGVPIIVSYTAPTIIGVAVDPTRVGAAPTTLQAFNTDGTQAIAVTVSGGTGPASTPITITYGPITGFEYTSVYRSHTPNAKDGNGVIRTDLVPGVGAALVVRVNVGGQISTFDNTMFIGYAAPAITSLSVSATTVNTTLSTYLTQQSATTPQRFDIVGTGFGRATDALRVLMTLSTSIPINGLTNQPFTVVLAPRCVRDVNNTHRIITCDMPSGAGTGYTITVTVGGQTSSSSLNTLSYIGPVVTGVSGVGSRNADTAGGQQVVLSGTNFGPTRVLNAASSNPSWLVLPLSITYGPTGTEYTASNCFIVAAAVDRQIACSLAPGTGRTLLWKVTVVGQASPPPPFNTSYGAPIVTSLSRSDTVYNQNSDNYATVGGETVFIDGTNFGPAGSLPLPASPAKPITVTYRQTLIQTVNSLNTSIGAAADGTVTYTATNCVVTIEHYQIRCTIVAGAGVSLDWTVVVDGQSSTQPLLGYRRPYIGSVTLFSGSPADSISTDGGETLRIVGSDFGPSINCVSFPSWTEAGGQKCTGYLKGITYGPLGTEYSFVDVHIVSPTEILVRTRPGFGGPFTMVITVADQESLSSTVSFSYAAPYITSITPTDGPTNPGSNTYAVVVKGKNFGIADPLTEVSILFGNPGDKSLLRSFIPTISPVITADTLNGGFTHSVTFYLPPGLLRNRAVRVMVHPRGQPDSPLRVISDPLNPQSGSSCFFDYRIPYIDSVVVSAAPTTGRIVTWVLSNVPGVTLQTLGSVMQIIVLGSNFGPDASVTNDAIVRQVLFSSPAGSSATVFSWSDDRIVAFTLVPAGTVFVQHDGYDWSMNPSTIFSNSYQYLRMSPTLDSVVGSVNNLATAGGDRITLQARYLDVTQVSLEIFVETMTATDGSPVYTKAKLFNASTGVEIITYNDIKTQILDPARANNPQPGNPDAAVFTVTFEVPPGEGINRKVYLRRDGTDTSDTNIQINYAGPSITSFEIYDEMTSTWGSSKLTSDSSNFILVPTLSTRVRLTGTNFGLCPKVTMGNMFNQYIVGAGTSSLCTATGALTVPTGEAANTHTTLTFMSAVGQGSGHDIDAVRGYTLTISSSGGLSTSPIKFRYLDPQILTVTSEGTTRGNVPITLTGYNFGALATGMSVTIGTLPCTNVLYTPGNSKAIQSVVCTLAEGSGSGYSVNFKSVPYTCDTTVTTCTATKTNAFSYSRPIFTSIFLGGSGSVNDTYAVDVENLVNVVSTGKAGAGQNVDPFLVPAWLTLNTADYAPYSSALASIPARGTELLSHGFPVRFPATGGHLVTLEGDNFGTLAPNQHCLFIAWGGRDRTRLFACDNAHTFVGENEVPALAILQWTHTRIMFIAPTGYGGREIIVNTNGVMPLVPPPMHYLAPVITAELDPIRGNTDGYEPITVTGDNFGLAPLSSATPYLRSTLLSFYPTTLEDYLTKPVAPQAALRVRFFRMCLSNHLDADGNRPSVLARCGNVPSVDFKHTTENVRFLTAPGIGVNRSVAVEVWDVNSTSGVWFNYTSNIALFSYLPPSIYSVLEKPVRMDKERSTYPLQLQGINLGNPPSSNATSDPWTPEELVVSVSVGGLPCTNADRFVSVIQSRTFVELRCTMSVSTVGYKNVSYTVAGQSNLNPATSQGAAFLACSPGYFGKVGELCDDCPMGASCAGFDYSLVKAGTQSEIDGGTHTYPRPLRGYYNMNSSDSKTTDMYSQCPTKIADRYPGRDVCIVGCEPPEACLADNYCAFGYRSVAPYYRCATCDTGFYKRNNECVRCPDSPYGLVIGFLVLVIFGALAAYVLNKKRINIGFIAIGVDWAQVIAIFAASKVAWPPIVKDLFHILSAFNLNIEIVAPECVVPDLQYKQKWGFIMALPVSLTVFFMLVTAVQVFYRMCIKGRKVTLANQGSSFMSMVLLLMYVLYIYVTRNILDVFNCQPREPDEGKFYLTAGSGEECYVPGGTQQLLFPGAVAAAFFYIVGYPLLVAYIIYSNRFLAAEDQLIRAKGVGDDKLSNPRAYVLRKRFSRVYYQFKPQYVFWILAIILRKFCLAATYILFNRNASFQLAAALLVIFVAYAAQMKYAPYMGPGDYDGVLRDYQARATSGDDRFAAELWNKLRNIEARGRKKVRRNLMKADGKVDGRAILGLLQSWLFNYNTVEEIMLFSAGVVAIMGIMYASLNTNSTTFADARDSVTWLIVGTIILTIIYFFTVLLTEVYILYTEDARRRQLERRSVMKRTGKDVDDTSKADKEAIANAGRSAGGEVNIGTVQSSFNPMFEGSQSTAGLREAVATTGTLPSVQLWTLFRQGYRDMQDELKRLQGQAAEIRVRQQKMEEAASLIESATGKKVDLGEMSRPQQKRKQFGPTTTDASSPDTFGSSSPMVNRRIASSQSARLLNSGGNASPAVRSLAALKRK